MFKQARQSRAFEDVIFQIQEAILKGRLKDGDKLPSERQLRETFRVSRGTLREALRALEQKRLIQIKTGVKGGAVVCAVSARQVSDSLELLLRYQKINLRELAEFREEVEGSVAAKAAKMAKKEDIKQLKRLLESIKNHLGNNSTELSWDEIIKEDNKFHLKLAQIAGNKLFESVLYTVYDNIHRYFERFLPRDIGLLKKIYRDLCRITRAIEKRDHPEASTLVRRHVRQFNRMMEKGENHQRLEGLSHRGWDEKERIERFTALSAFTEIGVKSLAP